MYVSIGVGEKSRILDIRKIASALGKACCDALPALHAFTGNDYTSGFQGQGKGKQAIAREQEHVCKFRKIR